MTPTPPALSFTADHVRLDWSDGRSATLPAFWLRDNLPGDRDPRNGQRLIDVTDLPIAVSIARATLSGGAVTVHFAGEPTVGTFGLDWLESVLLRPVPSAAPRAQPWRLGGVPPARHDFAFVTCRSWRTDDAARYGWLRRVWTDGLAFLDHVPTEPGALAETVGLVGRLVETNYGAVFDVKSVPQPENLAYTDRGLGLHTDNPYRDPVPGFQALHVLAAAPRGGDSIFADGFALGTELRRQAPQHFEVLTRTAVPFLFRSATAELYAERPLIELGPDGEIRAVNYNSRSIAPMSPESSGLATFFAAYRLFARLLLDDRFQLRLRMEVGQLVLFDNRRILHGRAAFTASDGTRHLRGCYLARDSVQSETALLRRRLAGQ
jgi:Taurine catabolism dioxygenase TauD, TfdA family/Gamma-butyrobetaine hydroxylase-like, N-terminal